MLLPPLMISFKPLVQHAPTHIPATHLVLQRQHTPIHATTLTPMSSARMMIAAGVTNPSQRRCASHWATVRLCASTGRRRRFIQHTWKRK
uniref:Uncharacterized protein n=1 Tax=Arundo donax TaxID=35708 RepID=A0A0A9AYG0_ARUDO